MPRTRRTTSGPALRRTSIANIWSNTCWNSRAGSASTTSRCAISRLRREPPRLRSTTTSRTRGAARSARRLRARKHRDPHRAATARSTAFGSSTRTPGRSWWASPASPRCSNNARLTGAARYTGPHRQGNHGRIRAGRPRIWTRHTQSCTSTCSAQFNSEHHLRRAGRAMHGCTFSTGCVRDLGRLARLPYFRYIRAGSEDIFMAHALHSPAFYAG